MSQITVINENGMFSVDRTAAAQVAEKVIAENGNLARLTEVERKVYYLAMCDRFALDPFSNPFDYLDQKGKLFLYPNVKAANAIGNQQGLTVEIKSRSVTDGFAEVEVRVSKPGSPRFVDEIGCVEVTQWMKRGDALKKAVTQARRRAILAYSGLADADATNDRTISSESYDPPIDAVTLSAAPVKTIDQPRNIEPQEGLAQVYPTTTKALDLLSRADTDEKLSQAIEWCNKPSIQTKLQKEGGWDTVTQAMTAAQESIASTAIEVESVESSSENPF